MNGLEIGAGVLFLAYAGVLAWLLVQAHHAPRGGRHLPGGLPASPPWPPWRKTLRAVAVAALLANGVLWLLRGLGSLH